MKVHNRCSYPLIAFGWHATKGYALDVTIPIGATADVNGPYLGEMGGGSCYVALLGEITCHDDPDNEKGFHVGLGEPLSLDEGGDRGVTVRHHTDPVEDQVAKWRAASVAEAVEEWLANGD